MTALRPTRAGVLTLAAAPAVSALALAGDTGLWPFALFLHFAALLALAADALLAPPRAAADLTLATPAQLYIGDADPAEIGFAIRVDGAKAAELALDVGPPLTAPPPWRGPAPGDPGVVLTVDLAPTGRGEGEITALWARWTGPLGLIWVETRRRIDRTLLITPDVRAVSRRAIVLRTPDAAYGVKAQRFLGEGSEFEALREYARGMDPRGLDWKQSARHRKLLCKEFRAERNHPVVIGVDAGYLMSEPLDGAPRLDRAINAGLLLAYEACSMGDLVGLFAFDAQPRAFVPPRTGMAGYRAVQRAASGLDYGEDETNYALAIGELGRRLNRRALIVLFTEFVDTVTAELMVEAAAKLTRKHLVLCVAFAPTDLRAALNAAPADAETIAAAAAAETLLADRGRVLGELERAGAHVIDAQRPNIGPDVVNRYIAFKKLDMA